MITNNTINYYTDEDGKLYLPNTRVYFDYGAHQFTSINCDTKLCNLGYLISKGLELPEIIMKYCDNHSDYIVDAVKPTLLYYIQMLRWGESIHSTDELMDDMTEVELAMLLQEEISLRYMRYDYSEEENICYSNWDDSILEEMVNKAKGDKNKLIEILTTTDFSAEFLKIQKL